MTHPRHRCLLTALLILAGAAMAGCAATGPAAELEPPARVQPARGETHLALGSRLLAANEPALAMRAFNASISLEGLSAEALTGAGIAAQRQGMLGMARAYLERARDLVPDSAIAHSNLGVVLLGLRDYHGARTAFRSAMLLSEDGGQEGGQEGGDAALRRYLERAEMAIAARNRDTHGDPAATQRVVRLGSDWFRLTEKTDGGAGATDDASLGGIRPAAPSGEAEETGAAAPSAPAVPDGPRPAAEVAAAVEAGTGRRADSGIPARAAGGTESGTNGVAGPETVALAEQQIDDGAE